MLFLKQSTAVSVKIGPFVDSTDGVTAETGLTLSQADIRLSKNGGAFAQKTDAGAATTNENGYYDCPVDATDTGTLGRLQLAVNEAGACPVWHEYTVLIASAWDMLFNTGNFSGTVGAAASVTGAVGSVTGAVASVTGAVGSVTGNVGGNVVGSTASVTGAVGSVTGNVGGTVASVTGAVGSVTGNVGGSVASVTGAVGSVTGNVGGSVASVTGAVGSVTGAVGSVTGNVGGSVASLGAQAKLDVNAEADTALADINLDHLIKSAVDTNLATTVADNSVLGYALATSVVSGFDRTTESAQAIRDRGDAAWITATGFSTHSAADVWSVAARILTANTNFNDPTAAVIADAVWDELSTGHVTAGKAGEQLWTDLDAILDDTGTAGVASVTGAVGSVTGNVGGSVASVTGNVGGSVASVTGAVGSVTGAVGSVTGAVGSVTGNLGGNVTGTIGGLSAAALADLFDTNSGTTYAAAIAGSVVKEIADNAGGSGLTAAGIADAVWDEAATGHTDAGKAGAQVWTDIDAILSDTGTDGVAVATGSKTGYALSAAGVDAVWDEVQTGHTTASTFGKYLDAAISGVGGAVGSGAITHTLTVNDSQTNPLDGVEVWITTDSAGTNVVAGVVVTNASGQAVFHLDAGTYYAWKQLSGYNFTNPEAITVS